jgi:hypothetical protein
MTTNPAGRPRWLTGALIGGVVLAAVVAGVLVALLMGRDAGTGAGDPSPSPSPGPSEPVAPSADPSASEDPSPTAAPSDPPETPVAAPDEWTLVHSFGDESTRWAGGEIAWGDAGFLAIGRRYEGGEGGPRIAEYSMWQSGDGETWTQVPYPAPGDGGRYDPAALMTAADGSYVLHALQFSATPTETPLVSLRSTDGTTWEPIDTGLPAEMFVQSVEEDGPSGYLLVGGQGGETNPTLWLSADGLRWELVHEFSQDETYVQLDGSDGGAEGYVVMGRRIQPDSSTYERFAFASADGREWVEATAPFGADDQAFVWDVAVTSRGGDWLATLGDPSELITLYSSPDGLAWTEIGTVQGNPRSLASTGLFEEIGPELILSPGATVSELGTPGTWSSTDGTTWAPVDLGADAFLGELAHGNGVVALTGTVPGPGGSTTSTGAIWIRAAD